MAINIRDENGSHRIRLDVDIIYIRFKNLDMDTVSDVGCSDLDTDRSEPL